MSRVNGGKPQKRQGKFDPMFPMLPRLCVRLSEVAAINRDTVSLGKHHVSFLLKSGKEIPVELESEEDASHFYKTWVMALNGFFPEDKLEHMFMEAYAMNIGFDVTEEEGEDNGDDTADS